MKPLQIGEVSFDLDIENASDWNDSLKHDLTNFIKEALDEIKVPDGFRSIENLEIDLGEWSNTKDSKQRLRQLIIDQLNDNINLHKQEKIIQPYPKSEVTSLPIQEAQSKQINSIQRFQKNKTSVDLQQKVFDLRNQIWNTPQSSSPKILNQWVELFKLMDIPASKIQRWVTWYIGLNDSERSHFQKLLHDLNLNQVEKIEWDEILRVIYQRVYNGSLIDLIHTAQRSSIIDEIVLQEWNSRQIPSSNYNPNFNLLFNGLNPSYQPQVILEILSRLGNKPKISNWEYWILIHLNSSFSSQAKIRLIKRIEEELKRTKAPKLISDSILIILPSEIKNDWIQYISNQENIAFNSTELINNWFNRLHELTPLFNQFLAFYQISQNEFKQSFSEEKWTHLIPAEQDLLMLVWNSINRVSSSQSNIEWSWNFTLGFDYIFQAIAKWSVLKDGFNKQETSAILDNQIEPLEQFSSGLDTTELKEFLSWLQEKNEIKASSEGNELSEWLEKLLDWEKRRKSASDDFSFQDTIEFHLFLQRFNKEEILNLYESLSFDLTPRGLINLWLQELIVIWSKIQPNIPLGRSQNQYLEHVEEITALFEALKEEISARESSSKLYVMMLKMYHYLIPFILELTKFSFIPQTKIRELQKRLQEVSYLSDSSDLSDQLSSQNDSTLQPLDKQLYYSSFSNSSFRLIPLEIRKILLLLYKQIQTQDDDLFEQIDNFAEYLSVPDYLWFSINRAFQNLSNNGSNPSTIYQLSTFIHELFQVISVETPSLILEFIQRMISSSLDELDESKKDKIDTYLLEQQAESYFQTGPSENEQRIDFIRMASQKISYDSIVNHDILGLALIAQDEDGPIGYFKEITENLNAHNWFAKLRTKNNQGYYQLSQTLALKKVVGWVSKRYTYQWVLSEESIWDVQRYVRDHFGVGIALKFLSRVKFRLMMLDSPKTKLDWALILTEELFLIQSLNLSETKNWLGFLKKNIGLEQREVTALDDFVQPRLKNRISTHPDKFKVKSIETNDSPNNYKYFVEYIFTNPLIHPSEIRTALKSLELDLTIEKADQFWVEIIQNTNAILRNETWNPNIKNWVKTQIKAWIATAKKTQILKELISGDADFWNMVIEKLNHRDILEIIRTSDYIHPFFETKLNSISKEVTLVDQQNEKSNTNPIVPPKTFEELNKAIVSLDWVNPKVESSLFLTLRKINRAIEEVLEKFETGQTLDLDSILFKSLSDNIHGELDLFLYHLVSIAIINEQEQGVFIKHFKPWMEQFKSSSLGAEVFESQDWITEITDELLSTWLKKIHAIVERLWYEKSPKTESDKGESILYQQIVSHLKHEITALSQQSNRPQFFHLTGSNNMEQHWAAFENRVSQKFEQHELFWQPIRGKLASIFDDNQILLLEEFTKKIISRIPDAQEDLFTLIEEIANKSTLRKELIIRESFIPKVMGWLIQSGIESHAGMSHLLWVSSILSIEVLPNSVDDGIIKPDFHELDNETIRPYVLDIFKGRMDTSQKDIINLLQQIDDSTVKMLEQKIGYEFQQYHKKPNVASKLLSSNFQELFNSEIPLRNELKSIETAQIKNEEIKKEIDRGTRFKTAYCGLMLLAPFYSTLFRRLNWVEKQEFKSELEQVKAYRLLLYIAELNLSDEEKNKGNQDLIARIIAGIPAENEISILEDISESDQAEAQTFLKAVIGQWPIMANASLEGFVESFLQREGIAFKSEDKWNIEVEGRGADIILKTLPWGYGTMKFPWAPYIVYTTWEIP